MALPMPPPPAPDTTTTRPLRSTFGCSIPSLLSLPPITVPALCTDWIDSPFEGHRQADPAALEITGVAARFLQGELELTHPRQEPVDEQPQFQLSEVLAEAVVLTQAEGDDAGNAAIPDELGRVLELALVARSRVEHAGDALSGPHELARYRDIAMGGDRKSTRLNSSHVAISYAVFCLKKKKMIHVMHTVSAN